MEKCKGLSEVAIRYSDGTINVFETLAGIETQLYSLQSAESESLEAISNAVHQVFDDNLGATLAMPAVCSFASALMGVEPKDFVETQKAVGLWVRTSNQFKITKGKGGGVVRLRDIPEKG